MRNKVDILKAVSEMNRIRILMMLCKKELCVCEITSILGLNTSTVSSHLSILKNVGLIEDTKNGKWINYNISKKMHSFTNDLLQLIINYFELEEQIKCDIEKLNNIDRYQIVQFNSKIKV